MASTINFLRLLADPTRLRLMLLLEQEELTVAELQEILGMGQSRISSHLAQLKRAGVVQDRRAGKNVYYLFCANGRTKRANILISWRENLGAAIARVARGRHSHTP
jgi:DNA-binding transcriptional ArsR family regulator